MPLNGLNEIASAIRASLPGLKLDGSASWQSRTTLGAGLGGFVLAEPETHAELKMLLRLCMSLGLKVETLGAGSNFLGSDLNSSSVFIKLGRREFGSANALPGDIVEAGAAMRLADLIAFTTENALGGAAGLSGIPGTLGGALSMNAGANGVSIGSIAVELSGILSANAQAWKAEASALRWGYRSCSLPDGLILTGAKFKFKESSRDAELALVRDEIARRARTTPKGRSAGSVFKNPSPELPAGLLIDRCGLKGRAKGMAAVSEAHANWIVCQGTCPESDFAGLAAEIASEVAEKTGVALTPELRFANMASKKKILDSAKRLKVAVLKGGASSEREVSLISGAAVAAALREAGHDVTEIDIQKLEILPEMRAADVIFPVLHGGFGEDGRIQELLEKAGMKYVGCPSSACKIIMDKQASKRTMSENGITSAPYALISSADAPLPEGFSFPVIVKPPSEGSTVGISLVEDAAAWRPALELALKYSKTVLVEKFIKGVESTVGILLGKPLPLVEIRYPGKIYDYDAKYTHALGETEYLCPPKGISEESQKRAQEMALKFFKAVGGRDMLRVDVIVGDDGFICVLEGNSIPGFTSSSLLPKAAKASGVSFTELCAKLAASAAAR